MSSKYNINSRLVRKLLTDLYKLNSELDAFIIDHYPEIYSQLPKSTDTTDKHNILLRIAQPEHIFNNLCKIHPDIEVRIERLLQQRSPSSDYLMAEASHWPQAASESSTAHLSQSGIGALTPPPQQPTTLAPEKKVTTPHRVTTTLVFRALLFVSMLGAALLLWVYIPKIIYPFTNQLHCDLKPWLPCIFYHEISMIKTVANGTADLSSDCSEFVHKISKEESCHPLAENLYPYIGRLAPEIRGDQKSVCYNDKFWLACILHGNDEYRRNNKKPNESVCQAYKLACEYGQMQNPKIWIACAPLYVRDETYRSCKQQDKRHPERIHILQQLCSSKNASACHELGNLYEWQNEPAHAEALKWFHQACELRKPRHPDCPKDDWLRPECDTGGANGCLSAGRLLKLHDDLNPPIKRSADQYLDLAKDYGAESP